MSPERSVFTKPPRKTLVLLDSYQREKNIGSPPLPTNTGYNTHLAHTHTDQWQGCFSFFKEEGSKFSWTKNKRFENSISMPFFFTFGLKYTRQTADVELCREGIEVSHRGGALFHRVPRRWDKTSLARSCEVEDVAGEKKALPHH